MGLFLLLFVSVFAFVGVATNSSTMMLLANLGPYPAIAKSLAPFHGSKLRVAQLVKSGYMSGCMHKVDRGSMQALRRLKLC